MWSPSVLHEHVLAQVRCWETHREFVADRDSGAITESEFDALKAGVLDGSESRVVRDSLERPSGLNIGPYVSWWLSQRSTRFIANVLAVVLIGAAAWLSCVFVLA
jgi:hypothetical protein